MTARQPFYLFGMGNRRKFLYKSGALYEVMTGNKLLNWDIREEQILESAYTVVMTLKNGAKVRLYENEQGVYLENATETRTLSESPIHLPEFEGHPNRELLRTLMNELLVNIVDGKPLPSLMGYDKPWYRDGAMTVLALKETGNLDLVRDWVLTLDDVFDHNNAGHEEADNLGQVLVMLALCGADKTHPLAQLALVTLKRFEKDDYISGNTDFAPHPFYQTGWVKWGLELMGVEDPYDYPDSDDSYAPLFWMNDSPRDSIQCFEEDIAAWYPYMKVAELHYYGEPIEKTLIGERYPYTWESHGSEADFSRMAIVDEELVRKKVCMPHAWHAAELILHLLDGGAVEA